MTTEELTERSGTLTPLFKQFQNSVTGLRDFGYADDVVRMLFENTLAGRGVMLAVDPAYQADMNRFAVKG